MYNFIQHFRDYLRLREAVNTADEHHAKDGDRYYVMPSLDGKLVIMDRKNFRLLKRKHYISQDVTLNQLRSECFYHTPYANGTDRMPAHIRKERAEKYYEWITTWRKAEKMRKKDAKRNKKGAKG
ncbi:MAG: hypothetical protein IJQ60_10025 [Prevotella sp.]|nr:hypothetical protein [Prevotella sp.]